MVPKLGAFVVVPLLVSALSGPGWSAELEVGEPELVADLCSGSCSSKPQNLRAHRGRLYFGVLLPGDETAVGLWRHEPWSGSLARILRDATTPVASLAENLVVTRSFRLEVLGPEGATTLLIEDLVQDVPEPIGVVAGGDLFVGASSSGQSIWATDGTPDGTRRLLAGENTCDAFPSDRRVTPDGLTPAGDSAYFILYESGCDTVLWRTDGTVEGTVRVAGASLGLHHEPAGLGTSAVYATTDDELWITDGTPGSARRLATFGREIAEPLVASGSLVYFRVAAEEQGRWSLWRTDGTVAGTFRLVDSVGSSLGALDGGGILFVHNDGRHGWELWRTDGTSGGGRLVRDIVPGLQGAGPGPIIALGETVIFAADDGVSGREPWLSDGTREGTVPLGDVRPGPEGSALGGFPAAAAVAGGAVYFAAEDGVTGRELWRVPVSGLGGEGPPPPTADATEIFAPELTGYRVWVRITAGGEVQPVRREPACIPETLCVSGAVPGRPELFVRIVGPKPNGRLWPTLVRFTTSAVDVWLEQVATGELRHYRLDGAEPGTSELGGLFDRGGFPP